ncbi:MAG TPA: lipopolysaccharide heptosyltransferase II [Desulfomonilaceae bacterium]|nr:lipopolysaccharide heptosyltransferase II [Desulfomonilaceae bacterium]
MSFSLAPPGKPSRILVRGTNWLGDTVMSLPAIKEIRRLFPSAYITLWAPASLAALWEVTGIADDIISFDNNSGGPWRRPYRMRKRLVSKDFDLVVLFQNAFESAFTAWLARIPMRAGYPTDMRGLLLNIKVPLTQEIRRKHQVFYYLAITDFLAKVFQIPASPGTRPADCSIPLREELLNSGKNELLSRRLDPELPLFCLCPGSVNSDAKRWPVDYFAELADLLIAHVGGQVVFLGTAQEHALIETIRSLMQNRGSVNLAGTADVVTAMAVMKLSTAVISNDTGSAHLAAAACAPVLTIFGPTSPGATAPYGPHSYTIQGEAPCAPCRHFRCPVPGQPCMRSVEPGTVFRKIQGITIPDP